MRDSVTGTVGDDAATVGIGKGIHQDTSRNNYGGSVFVVGRDGERGEMASSDYVVLLLEQVNQRVLRVEQLSLQAATDQASNRAELVQLRSDVDKINVAVRDIQQEREKEKRLPASRLNQRQFNVLLFLLLLAVIFLAGLLWVFLSGGAALPIVALLGIETWRTYHAWRI
jgi:hypothetical protein